jgi:hypothetical protein
MHIRLMKRLFLRLTTVKVSADKSSRRKLTAVCGNLFFSLQAL